MTDHPDLPFAEQGQDVPGRDRRMTPRPDQGEDRWRDAARRERRFALITGGDGVTGRAAAIADAREGADLAPASLKDAVDDRASTTRAVERFGRAGPRVDTAAHQRSLAPIEDVSDAAGRHRLITRTAATFHLTEDAIRSLTAGLVPMPAAPRSRYASGAIVAITGSQPIT